MNGSVAPIHVSDPNAEKRRNSHRISAIIPDMRIGWDQSDSVARLLMILMLCPPLLAAEKAPQRFNVRRFGAVGDGVADDQPAITRAAQTMTQNKGGVL